MNAADLARALKANRTTAGWSAKCPAHDDHRPSLSIGEGENGKLLLKCFAGCEFDAILKAAGVEPTNANGADHSKPHIVATYDYHAATGKLVFQVVRYAPKDFRQRRPDGNGDWIWSMKGVERVPYRLPQLLSANEVYITEGEKDCDNLRKLGLAATTNPGGSGQWPDSFARWFDGRHAIILPDNDQPGRDHAQDVARKLSGHAASVRLIELPNLPPKGDVTDWLAAGSTIEELEDIAQSTPAWTPEQAKPIGYTLLRDLKPNLSAKEVVKDLIPRRAFGEVHAESGGGKTAIMVDLGLHIADGREYRTRRVERQPVIYIALEGHGGIENRIIAAAAELGIEDAPFALVKATDNFRDPAAAERVGRIAAELMQQFGGDNPVFIVDTYTAALGAGASDCDPKDVSAFIQNVQQHLLVTGTVCLCHHFGKDSSRGSRGWSGLNAALDFELEIDRDGDLRTMRVTKSRDGSDTQPACCYNLVSRVVGKNEYDEEVTAVVVEHLADEDVAKRGKRFSPKARSSFNSLWQCIKDRARSWSLQGETAMRYTLMKMWEEECIKQGVLSNSSDIKQRRRMFRQAVEELEAAGAIIIDGENRERVYPAPKQHSGEQR